MYVLYIHRSLSTSLCLDEPQLQAAENLYDLKDYLESPMVPVESLFLSMTTFWLSLIGYWKPSVNLFYRVCWLVRGYAATSNFL